jgi:hypothetical protein
MDSRPVSEQSLEPGLWLLLRLLLLLLLGESPKVKRPAPPPPLDGRPRRGSERPAEAPSSSWLPPPHGGLGVCPCSPREDDDDDDDDDTSASSSSSSPPAAAALSACGGGSGGGGGCLAPGASPPPKCPSSIIVVVCFVPLAAPTPSTKHCFLRAAALLVDCVIGCTSVGTIGDAGTAKPSLVLLLASPPPKALMERRCRWRGRGRGTGAAAPAAEAEPGGGCVRRDSLVAEPEPAGVGVIQWAAAGEARRNTEGLKPPAAAVVGRAALLGGLSEGKTAAAAAAYE